jgi:hypothetical protein
MFLGKMKVSTVAHTEENLVFRILALHNTHSVLVSLIPESLGVLRLLGVILHGQTLETDIIKNGIHHPQEMSPLHSRMLHPHL